MTNNQFTSVIKRIELRVEESSDRMMQLLSSIHNLTEENALSMGLLFVSRYPQSKDLCQWLASKPNRYVHFGDFDLAGIHIFLTEFHRHLADRASFLIPADIEQRLSAGSLNRYNDQLSRFKHLSCDIPELQSLIDLINKYHRCYDQEGYIESPAICVAESRGDEA